jgi:tetratricopeptide (TPR) repeat protein
MHGKRYDEAHLWIQKAIQLDPGNMEFRIDDAKVLVRLNRNKDAIDDLEFALKIAQTPEQTAAVEKALESAQQLKLERARPR